MNTIIDIEHLGAKLEAYEEVYADLTDGRALIVHQDGMHFRFDDGAEARSLSDAVMQARALVRFVFNQACQQAM
jgi:hypothetical protein